jgi:Flp pilus assembly protein TadD
MNPHEPNEEQIAAILALSETDAAPPDHAALEKLRAQSTAAFAAAMPSSRPSAGYRNARWLTAAAAAILVALGVFFWLLPGSGPALGQVLENVAKADTLHARFSRGKEQLAYWRTREPNRSRWDDLNGHYRITDGSMAWTVDEAAYQAKRTQPPADASDPVQQFLTMLGVGDDRGKVQAALPVKRMRDGDEDILVYRIEVAAFKARRLEVEAIVVARTQRLHSIHTRIEELGQFRPFADLTILAYNEPIGAGKFAIADTLTEDGRIGKVTDVQGIVTIKPVMHERWTPVREGLVLRPGDWVRTDARGANATSLRLVKQTGIILGPKTLVELIGPKQIRVIQGEVEVTPTSGTTVELLGPGAQKVSAKGKQLYRVEKQQLVQVAKDPPWLAGFKGATTNEALGSLVALVDGRNVPLTVGYHKVTVDIRDQIARTVIEESFVNHTNEVLEGVFHFPLPADASISGFGMWIGDNLVEADVVEKQRAREIYETILREKRDPGLLEWSGGNIFKARVYPIAANSEKRIKITYTQVLPLKGNRYRYSYALQSELLQQHPLRDLSIDVKINSVAPLKSVTSPTHPTRDKRTVHSAHVEFTALEYTPSRDFEVVVELEGKRDEVVVIPHRRGDDGYLLLQLTPPGGANGDRPILPNGEPLQLLIVADTSASIDASQRATQATFIGSLLAALSPKDTFNLATCDVTCDWTFAQPKAAETNNVAAARDMLAKRTSLGWSNLDLAFASALKQSGPKTHVIYVGDGIVTTGDADPVAFAKRLRRMWPEGGPTFHAVTLGSSYEAGVLKAIASLGSGSMRKITGEQTPATVARELLSEIAQPALRDIKVEFKGIKVARVYPETLANVPAGTQQILLGRYLPQGKDQTGEVIVTGTQGGKPVRYSTHVSLKDAEQGNSFIPRLWARMHLDSLLEQGSSDTIKDEIIALSEEFQIITPYTSLLVLETDADRERFKVKRRFQMRDGERFFADGRDNAVFDLKHKQMQRAGAWRTALRRSVLSELAKLGRDPRMFQPVRSWEYDRRLGRWNPNSIVKQSELEDLLLDGTNLGSSGGWAPLGESMDRLERLEAEVSEFDSDAKFKDKDIDGDRLSYLDIAEKQSLADLKETFGLDAPLPRDESRGNIDGGAIYSLGRNGSSIDDFPPSLALLIRDPSNLHTSITGGLIAARSRRAGPQYASWLNTLFPPLPAKPGKTTEPKSDWPAAARDLAKSLLRTEQLAKLTGGIEVARQSESFDVRWGDLTTRSNRLDLIAAKSWLTRSESDGGQTLVEWCDAKERGIYSKAFQLGRVRASTPSEVQPPPLALNDHSLTSLEQSYAGFTPTLEPQGKDRTLLVLKRSDVPHNETRILIDSARHVILSVEERHKSKVTNTTRFDDFIEAAGSWWARKVETTNEDGKRVSLVTQTVRTLTANELDQRTKTELAGLAPVQLLRLPLPSVADAKKAFAEGKATFHDHFVLLLHFHRSQQWPRVFEHLQSAEKLTADKPGLRWVRSALLYDSRRHDDLRQRYLADAANLAKWAPTDAYFLAEYLIGQSANVLQANEMLTLLDTLQPLYDKQPPHVQARKRWLQQRTAYLAQTGRSDEALRLHKQLANDYPRDYALQQQYANALANTGDYPAAYAWLTRVLVKDAKWYDWEEDALRNTHAQLLQQQGRYADLAAYLSAWVERNPPSRTAYEQYLTALIKTDQIEKADALALRWLQEAQVPGELAPVAAARLQAAMQFMMGNGYQLYTNRVEERWLAPLAQAARYFARHETQASITEQIVSQQHFARTDEGRKLRKDLAAILTTEIDKLSAEQIRRFAGWLHADDAEPAAWTKAIGQLRQRWLSEAKDETKHVLGAALVTLLSRQETSNEPLTVFLRLQYEKGPAKYRTGYANQLFNRLLQNPWQAELEAEAFALLDKLSDSAEPGMMLYTSVAALHRLTDGLLENRIAAHTAALEHPEKLTRTELHKKQAEFRQQAREGVANRLRKEAAKHPKALANWLIAESVYLDITLDRSLKQAQAEAWEVLGAVPKKIDDDVTLDGALEEALRQRYFITLMNLAARKNAEPALVERLTKYVDQGVALVDDANRWRAAKYRLLVALDRSKELEQSLRAWTRANDPDNRWRIALGYLLAEQGRLPEAILQFEAVEAADELTPAHYAALAEWYLVQNRRSDHERAASAVYRTMPEYQLSQRIALKLQPWHRADGKLPTELDQEVLRMFNVLFDKSQRPQAYLYQLQQFYQASHDFRLLSGLPDAVIGHSAARVYPFIEGMQSVLNEVRDEATADEIVKHIGEVRLRAKTNVDKRALDMFETLVERRAAELQNQPGPHAQKALDALVRVSNGNWSPGEPRLMADYLASLGKITQPHLADEQLRQLRWLRLGETGRQTLDSLHIAHREAVTLNGYQRRKEAIDLLQAELNEFQTGNKGVLPVSANDVLMTYLGMLESAGHFAKGENVLLAQLKNPVHTQQRRWLNDRLDRLYHHALQSNGDVSLGKGGALYQALERKLHKELADPDQNHRYQSLTLLCQVYRTAHDKKLPDVVRDVKAFAFEIAPPILKEQTTNHDNVVSTIAHTVRDLAGPRDGIVFLLNEIEAEPRWLRYNNQDGWNRHAYVLADWRREAKDLGDAEGRLLKLVLAELRRDLETHASRNRAIYHWHADSDRFWKEKTADFTAVAEEVWSKRKQSGASVQYLADYFYWGLRSPNRAIEILFIAHKGKLLDEDGQAKLIDFLHRESRYADSIPVLQPLVERKPGNLDYRVQLMHAYFRTDRRNDLPKLLKQTDAYFHEQGRWGEYPLQRLANSTLQNELYEQSAAYFKELIPLHERTQPNRGIGNGTLATYYIGLANAYAGLKRTPDAVEAASGAIVAWGKHSANRANALNTLKQVLLRSPDLDAFVAHFDAQKQDSAIIRKALGQAFQERKEHAKAIQQLEVAAVLQLNDAEIYQLLVTSHDALGDQPGAVRQLLQAVQHSGHDVKLYQELGKRYALVGQSAEAERAVTSIVEVLPTEAESHALLAEVREKQNRWADAIQHWERVAQLRELEPTGLLKLAAAQIHEQRWDDAERSLRRLNARSWPPRFRDVHTETRTLEVRLANARKKGG